MAGFGTDFFPIFYQTGGGGSTIPTITASVTLNVPATYPTINDALDFVRSAVVLDGALVTIAVDGAAYTMTDQLNVIGETFPFVSLVATAPVSIDSTAFVVNTPFGVASAFYFNQAVFGSIVGAWNFTAGAPCLGFLAVKSDTVHGDFAYTATQFTGFIYNAYIVAGSFTSLGTTYSGALVGPSVLIESARATLSRPVITATGATKALTVQSGATVDINGTGQFITTSVGQALEVIRSSVTLDGVSLTVGAAQEAINLNRSTLNLANCLITHNCATAVITTVQSDAVMTFSVTKTGANNPDFVTVNGGRVSVNPTAFAGPVSIGVTGFTVNTGILQMANSAQALIAFTGGFNPAINVPVAQGLIIA